MTERREAHGAGVPVVGRSGMEEAPEGSWLWMAERGVAGESGASAARFRPF